LEINPEDPNQYRFDGEWLELEVRQAPIRVRIYGGLKITVKREVLWSVYGPVVRQEHGTYALRYAGYGLVNIWEGLYRLNKAADFAEWRAAMAAGGLPNFNAGYADAEGNIYYLYNAMLPLRAEGYDWRQYLPGNTSETLWEGYLPFERLPQVFNPPAGFIQNANSTPFRTTLDPWNPDPGEYSPTFDIDAHMTNRAMRALELLSADPEITFEEFYDYKYDWAYAENSEMSRFVRLIRQADLAGEAPGVIEAQHILADWDLRMSPFSSGATLAAFTAYFLSEDGYRMGILGSPSDEPPGEQAVLNAFTRAVEYLVGTHGGVDVPWGQVNRLVRGPVDVGLGGGVDVLHAINGRLGEDGRFVGRSGDSYVMLVWWDAEGQVRSYSIHQYGSATLDAASPHYADQALLFARRKLKPVWIEAADIRRNLEREYRPGEE
jgi:penicillin amidase/acyl-homoserine-lactone acylase